MLRSAKHIHYTAAAAAATTDRCLKDIDSNKTMNLDIAPNRMHTLSDIRLHDGSYMCSHIH